MKAIAFVGAHSSGKSSLINAYVGTHSSLRIHLITGITRAIIDRGFPLEKNSTVDSYSNYVRDQLRAERSIRDRDTSLLLSDRTVLDAASYAKVNSELPRPSVPDYFVEALLEIALVEASRFDMFVYCPVEFPMAPDLYRPLDEPYREKVSLQLKAFLEEYSLPHVIVSGDIPSRLAIVEQAIGGLDG
jgi:nicotinamide riboside kinase